MADTFPGFRLLARVSTGFQRVRGGAAARHVARVYHTQGIPRLHRRRDKKRRNMFRFGLWVFPSVVVMTVSLTADCVVRTVPNPNGAPFGVYLDRKVSL